MRACEQCQVCNKTIDGRTYLVHFGNLPVPEWTVPAPSNVTTHIGTDVSIAVATQQDLPSVIAATSVFPVIDPLLIEPHRQFLQVCTSFNGMAFPYICVARVNGQVAGKLFLDRNSNNAIRRNLHAAIVDSVMVAPEFEAKGIADKLLEFAELFALNNGVRWMEIGAIKERSENHVRGGTDSLRSYVRRGYYKQPLVLEETLDVHYQYDEAQPTLLSPRYGKAIVVYKDLNTTTAFPEDDRRAVFQKLVASIPN